MAAMKLSHESLVAAIGRSYRKAYASANSPANIAYACAMARSWSG